MTEPLYAYAIVLVLCWILGFFILAQFLHKQFEIARKLDKMTKGMQKKETCRHIKSPVE